jgi:hypothetical protein
MQVPLVHELFSNPFRPVRLTLFPADCLPERLKERIGRLRSWKRDLAVDDEEGHAFSIRAYETVKRAFKHESSAFLRLQATALSCWNADNCWQFTRTCGYNATDEKLPIISLWLLHG